MLWRVLAPPANTDNEIERLCDGVYPVSSRPFGRVNGAVQGPRESPRGADAGVSTPPKALFSGLWMGIALTRAWR